MNNPTEIKKLAWERIEEAEILHGSGKFDGAFYLAGYSVELMLKCKICENLGVPNLFDTNNTNNNLVNGIGQLRKTIKTHDLYYLLLLSGLKNKYDEDKANNPNLFKANSLLFQNWDENCRYKPCGSMNNSDVNALVNLLKSDNGLLKWIERQ